MLKTKENITTKPIMNKKEGHCYRQWIMTMIVNLSLVSYGYITGWVSPVIKVLQSASSPLNQPMTDIEISWMASVVCLSAVVAVPLYTFTADSYGRKKAIYAILLPQALCWMLTYWATNSAMLITARALGGVASGGCFIVIPLYVKEISQENTRGPLGALMVLTQNIGMLAVYAMGGYLDYYTVLWIVGPLPLVTGLLLLRAPESPAFLVKVGKDDEASTVVGYLRGLDSDHSIVRKEIDAIKSEDTYFKSIPNMSFTTIFKMMAWRRGFIKMMCVMSCHAVCGCMVITSYAVSLLESSGVSVSPELQTLSIPIVMILASFISMSVIERFGRKPVLVSCFVIAAASMMTLGSMLVWQRAGGEPPGWLTVLALTSMVGSYAAGISPVPYVVMAEMFNFQIRAKLLGIIVSYAWFLSFVQLIVYAPISSAFGAHTAFFAYGTINLCGVAASLVMPETKGKSVEQIEDELCGKDRDKNRF